MNIQITKNAIEYLAEMCGLGQEEAEEHLITAISMCKFPETNQAVRIDELEACLESTLPSLLNLKARVEKNAGEPLPNDSRLLVAINTAERLLAKGK